MTSADKPRSKMLELKERAVPCRRSCWTRSPEQRGQDRHQASAGRRAPHVPEIAERGSPDQNDPLDRDAMRKYGTVVEDSTDGSYVRYALAAKDPR